MTTTPSTPKPKRRYVCWNCGEEISEWDPCNCGNGDVCGKPECQRAARDAAAEARAEAENRDYWRLWEGW